MKTYGRRLAALLLVPVVAVLSGCLKMDTEIEITGLDDVNIRMLLAIEDTYASMISEACAEEAQPGTTVTPYNEDGFIGCTIEAEGFPADQLGATGQELSITEAEGEYTFTMGGLGGAADMSELGVEDGAITSAMFTSFRVAVTFPGQVTSNNGSSTVDGNTVTWTDPTDLLSGEGLKASGEAGPGWSGVLLWTALVALGVAAVVAVVVVLRRRNAPAPAMGGAGFEQPAPDFTAAPDAYPAAPAPGAPAPAPGGPQHPEWTVEATPGEQSQPGPGDSPADDPHSGPDFNPPPSRPL